MAMKRVLMMSAICVSLALAMPAYSDEDPATDECGASALQDRVGEAVTGSNAEDLQIGGQPVTVTARVVRVVGPDGAMTMDFRSYRLTIETDENGNLVSARCV